MSDQSQEDYIGLELMFDADTLTANAIDYMEEAIPGWTAQPGNPETILIEANAQMASEAIEQASEMPEEAMTYLGTTVYGFPMSDGAPARGTATITFAADTPATTIYQGAEVAVPHPSGDSFIFETDRDVVAPQGGGVVTCIVVASEYGADQNGCFGVGDLQEDYDGVASVSVDTTTLGADPEDPLDYLGRFSTYVSLLNPRPILPADFARRAQLNTRVGRATAINLYQPSTSEGGYGSPRGATTLTNVERCVTVVIMGEAGVVPPDDLLLEVYNDLDANREVNFLVYVIPPGSNGAYTPIDVRATVKPWPGVTNADAIAAAQDQITQWLSPQNRGAVPGASSDVDWVVDTKVRIYEAVDWINRSPAIWYVTSVEVKKSSDSTWVSTDITLTGAVPMPTIGATPAITIAP